MVNEEVPVTKVAKDPPEDVGLPRASLGVPARMNSMKGWLAPVYVNDVFLMLTVDTGAALTMMNATMFKKYFQDTKLDPSTDHFTTANGETMTAEGTFRANVQMGPVTIASLKITVADVVGDGLLGMDYLTAADAWLGARDG